jgi:hypothetical protein
MLKRQATDGTENRDEGGRMQMREKISHTAYTGSACARVAVEWCRFSASLALLA